MVQMYQLANGEHYNDIFMAPNVSKINISVEKDNEKEKGK